MSVRWQQKPKHFLNGYQAVSYSSSPQLLLSIYSNLKEQRDKNRQFHSQQNGSDYFQYQGGGQSTNHLDGPFVIEQGTTTQANVYFDPDNSLTAGGVGYIITNNNDAYLAFTSEL